MENKDISQMKSLWLEGIAQVDKDTAYASCSEFNALFKVNLESGDCTYIDLFPQEAVNKKRLHIKAVQIKTKIYFIPASASTISVYDLETKCFENILIEDEISNKNYNKKYKFADAFVYGEYIYILPSTYPAIVKLKHTDNSIDYLTENLPTNSYFFRPGTVQVGSKLFIPNTKDNLVMEFDMEVEKIQLHYIGENNKGSWSLVADGNYLWLIPKRQGSFVKWDYINNNVYEYNQYPEGYKESDFCFTKGYKVGEYIYALPAKANMVVKISGEGIMSKEDLFPLESGDIVTYISDVAGYAYLLLSNESGKLDEREFLKINMSEKIVQKYKFVFRYNIKKYIDDYFSNGIGQNLIHKESEICNLNEYQRFIEKGDYISKNRTEADISIGENIYQRIM